MLSLIAKFSVLILHTLEGGSEHSSAISICVSLFSPCQIRTIYSRSKTPKFLVRSLCYEYLMLDKDKTIFQSYNLSKILKFEE